MRARCRPAAPLRAPRRRTRDLTPAPPPAATRPPRAAKPFTRTRLAPGKPPNPSKAELAAAAALVDAAEGAPRKNFVQANTVENMLSAPKRAAEQVDWRKKPEFGQVPTYLKNIKREIAEEHAYVRSMQEAQAAAAPPGMRLMAEEEKDELLFALKTKWDATNVEYQKTCTLALASLDTIGKIKRCAARRPGASARRRKCADAPPRARRAWRSRRGSSPRTRRAPRVPLQQGAVRVAARADREGHREALQARHLGARRGALASDRSPYIRTDASGHLPSEVG